MFRATNLFSLISFEFCISYFKGFLKEGSCFQGRGLHSLPFYHFSLLFQGLLSLTYFGSNIFLLSGIYSIGSRDTIPPFNGLLTSYSESYIITSSIQRLCYILGYGAMVGPQLILLSLKSIIAGISEAALPLKHQKLFIYCFGYYALKQCNKC